MCSVVTLPNLLDDIRNIGNIIKYFIKYLQMVKYDVF